MQTKSFCKIWLLSINFEKFTSIKSSRAQSQPFRRSTVIGPSDFINNFIEDKLSKLTDNNQILRTDFYCIHFHFCEISTQIIECKIFAPYRFHE